MQEFINKTMLSLGLPGPEIERAAGCLLRALGAGVEDERFRELLRGLRAAHRMVRSAPPAAGSDEELAAARGLLAEQGLSERQVHTFIYMLLDHLQQKKGEPARALIAGLPQLAPYLKL